METGNKSSTARKGSRTPKFWRYSRYAFVALVLMAGGIQYAELLGEKASLEYQRHVYMTAACQDKDYLKYVLDEVVQPDEQLVQWGLWQEAKNNMISFCDDIPAAPGKASMGASEVACTAGN